MLKQAVAVLAIALAGTASAAGWKDLRVDGSSEAAFKESLAVFYDELSPERRHVFQSALTDIWLQGTAAAKADHREFTVSEYQLQLDGLSYDEVVSFTDPSGDTAKERYREAKRTTATNSAPPVSAWQQPFRGSDSSQRAAQSTRDRTMIDQGRDASPSVASGVPGATQRGTNSCGGNFGGCEGQPTVPK
jgi:hypothetical protein